MIIDFSSLDFKLVPKQYDYRALPFNSQQKGVSLESGIVSAKTNLAVTPHPVDIHN